jgi:hypothetical protein
MGSAAAGREYSALAALVSRPQWSQPWPNSLSPAEAKTLAVLAGRGADQQERVRWGTGPAAAATTSADAQAATREAFMLTKI